MIGRGRRGAAGCTAGRQGAGGALIRESDAARSSLRRDRAEDGGGGAAALDLVVRFVSGDLLEDVDGFVGGVGETDAGALASGAVRGVEVGLDVRRLEVIEEGAEGHARERGGVDESGVGAEHGDDDVGLVGGEMRERVEFGGHETIVFARRADARGMARMTGRLRAGGGCRGR